MSDYDDADNESIDLKPRSRRALEEPMTVLTPDAFPVSDKDRSVLSVTTGSGSTYHVDLSRDYCNCADQTQRHPDGGCKHLRRARIATGREAVPAACLGAIDIDEHLGIHVDAEPVFTTADGGVVSEGDDAAILETGARWEGPFTEYNKYGEPTGAEFLRCSDCGIEVLSGAEEHAYHRDDCTLEVDR